MWYEIKRDGNRFQITNKILDNLCLNLYRSSSCDIEENFEIVIIEIEIMPEETINFVLPSEDGLYKIFLTNREDKSDEIFIPQYQVILASLIEDLDYNICGCNCGDCQDCNGEEDNQDLLNVLFKILAYNVISRGKYDKALASSSKCIECEVIEANLCHLLNESIGRNIENKHILKKIISFYYLVFYYTDYKTEGNSQSVKSRYNFSKIHPCIKKLGLDIECIRENWSNAQNECNCDCDCNNNTTPPQPSGNFLPIYETEKEQYYEMLNSGNISDALWQFEDCKPSIHTIKYSRAFTNHLQTPCGQSNCTSPNPVKYYQIETPSYVYFIPFNDSTIGCIEKSTRESYVISVWTGNSNSPVDIRLNEIQVLGKSGEYVFLKTSKSVNSGYIICLHNRQLWFKEYTDVNNSWNKVWNRYDIPSQISYPKSVELTTSAGTWINGVNDGDIIHLSNSGIEQNLGHPGHFINKPHSLTVDVRDRLWFYTQNMGPRIHFCSRADVDYTVHSIQLAYDNGLDMNNIYLTMLKAMPNGKVYFVQIIKNIGAMWEVVCAILDDAMEGQVVTVQSKILVDSYNIEGYDFIKRDNDLFLCLGTYGQIYFIKLNDISFSQVAGSPYTNTNFSVSNTFGKLRADINGRVFVTINDPNDGRIYFVYENGRIKNTPTGVKKCLYTGITEDFGIDGCKYLIIQTYVNFLEAPNYEILALDENENFVLTGYKVKSSKFSLRKKGCKTVGFSSSTVLNETGIFEDSAGFIISDNEPLEYSYDYFTNFFDGSENTFNFGPYRYGQAQEVQDISFIKDWNIEDIWISHITSKGNQII